MQRKKIKKCFTFLKTVLFSRIFIVFFLVVVLLYCLQQSNRRLNNENKKKSFDFFNGNENSTPKRIMALLVFVYECVCVYIKR